MFFHAFQTLRKFGYFFNSWIILQEALHILLVRVTGMVKWRQVTSYLKQRVMLGKFLTERKYCYAFHTTLIYSLKNFTFSLQAHAYGPRIAVLFWNTETCYSSKRTCPVKWIKRVQPYLTTNKLYLWRFFCNCFYQ